MKIHVNNLITVTDREVEYDLYIQKRENMVYLSKTFVDTSGIKNKENVINTSANNIEYHKDNKDNKYNKYNKHNKHDSYFINTDYKKIKCPNINNKYITNKTNTKVKYKTKTLNCVYDCG